MAGGGTLREHLEQVAKQTGRTPRQLQDLPELWPAAEHIWEWFVELNFGKVSSLTSTSSKYMEIYFWSNLNNILIKPFEVRALSFLYEVNFKID